MAKKLTKSDVSDFLQADRARIIDHLDRFETMAVKVEKDGDKEERNFFVYQGGRSVKMLELLLKNNEAMIRYVEKFDEGEDGVDIDAWKNENEVIPATLDDKIFGER